MTSVGTLAAFAVVCLSVIWLRRTHPEIPRGYRVPSIRWCRRSASHQCLWLITSVPTYVLVIFAWYTAAMIVLYFVYGMHNSELAKGHWSWPMTKRLIIRKTRRATRAANPSSVRKQQLW